ncbi:MAG: hypothetical protein ACXW34_03900 [Nitrospira sp.]
MAAIAAALLQCGSALAGDPVVEKTTAPASEAWCETPPPVEFRLGLPGWMAGMSGDFGVRGVVSTLDMSFADIFQQLDQVPLVLSAYARYHRWEFMVAGQYLKISDSVVLPGLLFSRADIQVKSAFVEAFVGYRLINCDKAVLSLYGGIRYNYMSGDLHVFDNGDPRFPVLRRALGIPDSLRRSGDKSWVDPVIGISGKVRLARPVSLYAKGDIGGFGAASDFTWQVQGGLEFQVTRWLYSNVGWRYMKYDYKSGGFSNETALNGPFIETGLKF